MKLLLMQSRLASRRFKTNNSTTLKYQGVIHNSNSKSIILSWTMCTITCKQSGADYILLLSHSHLNASVT